MINPGSFQTAFEGAEMKRLLGIFLVSMSLGAIAGEEHTDADTTVSALSPEIEPYDTSPPVLSSSKGVLENNDIAIGTILKSYHFDKDKYDYHDYNESHDGLYLTVNGWSAGTFINSADNRSVFITYNANLYRGSAISVDFVSGLANGYEGWENAQGDYLPILGVSAQWAYLKTIMTYDAVTLGVELSLN